MKILPAALTRPKKMALKKAGSDISTATAIALSMLAVAAVFIIGEAYLSRVKLTVDERSALLNTLLLCDVIVFAVSLLITALLWYLASVHYGSRDRRSLMGSKAMALYGILMLLPVIFVACDLSFKPLFFAGMEVEIALALSVIGIVSLAPYTLNALEYIKPRGILASLVEDMKRQYGSTARFEPAALQRPALRGAAGMGLATLLDRLCQSGDIEPVLHALDEMKDVALGDKKDIRSAALASSMVTLMAEAAAVAVRHGRHEVIYHALDGLGDVTAASAHPGVAALAFRSLGGVFNACSPGMEERALGRLEIKMMETYSSVFDRTGKHEALDLAAAMAGKAVGSKLFAVEEYDAILYAAGGVYRRLAEEDGSEEHADKALAVLYEALTARTAEAAPMDHACIKGELGRAYMAVARIKNPVKSYRSAAAAFEEAGKMLDVKTSPWDSASFRGRAACAYTLLADEYCRGKRYDDAIQAARSALALYPEVVKYFGKRSPGDHAEISSNLGFAHTIVSEVYLRSRMFDLSLKHASLALDAYSSAAKSIDPAATPERYAFMRTSMGQTNVTMAEIHFREKRYESAITACDSAIAAYNEAIRIYDERKKDRPATATRKSLKKANDLFNTMMRIGVADRKPLPLAVEP